MMKPVGQATGSIIFNQCIDFSCIYGNSFFLTITYIGDYISENMVVNIILVKFGQEGIIGVFNFYL